MTKINGTLSIASTGTDEEGFCFFDWGRLHVNAEDDSFFSMRIYRPESLYSEKDQIMNREARYRKVPLPLNPTALKVKSEKTHLQALQILYNSKSNINTRIVNKKTTTFKYKHKRR